ncbi:hypothetical protein [Auritidibacter sp. NML100628]|uniref:hypothetical protein n=1 Tax=Auritidibacter sp. NML100628 TaxID=2170742 RepID=UPI001F274017|nr:hypothetical protein [Auritidibacter sp. NML100628]
MSSRIEITKNYATAYTQAPKKPKAAILDTVTELTGWNRDHARQQLTRRTRQPKGRAKATVAVIDRPKTKARKYSYDAVKILPYVCSIAGGICGQYLAAAMEGLLDCLEAHPPDPGQRPLQPQRACQAVGDESGDHRPVPQTSP